MSVPNLTLTEERIVSLLAAGKTRAEVAAAVGLSPTTVDWHLARASRKLDRAAALRTHVGRDGSEEISDARRRRS